MTTRRTLDKEAVRALLLKEYSACLETSSDSRELVRRLKYGVSGMANHFGLRAVTDYSVQAIGGDRTDQRLDVVWLAGSAPVAAIEVSAEPTGESLEKLLASPAELRFWIYTGSEALSFFARQVDTQGLVSIIPDPSRMERGTSMTHAERDLIGPLTVDRHIRQAIQHCWTGLAEEDRSLERVEQEIAKLVWRALREFREDAKTFGFAEERPLSKSRRRARIRAEHARAYEPWTQGEDSLLRLRFTEGTSVEELSKLFHRQPSGIHSRLVKLGLIAEGPAG